MSNMQHIHNYIVHISKDPISIITHSTHTQIPPVMTERLNE